MGYRIDEIVSGPSASSRRKARLLAKKVNATVSAGRLDADLVWFCVPDREIRKTANSVASATRWKGKIALHSSGALPSDDLNILRSRGAAVASVHPLMTFMSKSVPALQGVPFALEGDARALRAARSIVRNLGAEPFSIGKNNKSTYHAWGGFTSPLLVALLVTGENVARAAGIQPADARKRMLPIMRQTLANYERSGPAEAFTGPIVRGDAEVVRKHLHNLKKIPEAKDVYLALARAGFRYLPSRNRKELKKVLNYKSS
jgi:predicted short-subunit dehydrogenase-like oxidoreductase (DUF2520 family)